MQMDRAIMARKTNMQSERWRRQTVIQRYRQTQVQRDNYIQIGKQHSWTHTQMMMKGQQRERDDRIYMAADTLALGQIDHQAHR